MPSHGWRPAVSKGPVAASRERRSSKVQRSQQTLLYLKFIMVPGRGHITAMMTRDSDDDVTCNLTRAGLTFQVTSHPSHRACPVALG